MLGYRFGGVHQFMAILGRMTALLVVAATSLVSCVDGTDVGRDLKPSTRGEGFAFLLQERADVGDGTSTAVNVYQALYGKAPANPQYVGYVSTIANTGAPAFAASVAGGFSSTSDGALAKLVLDNLDINSSSVTAAGSYAALLQALTLFFEYYGLAFRGQIILNLTNQLAGLAGDQVYGVAAATFNARTLINVRYSANPANLVPGVAVLPGTLGQYPLAQRAAALAVGLGKPSRLLIGLGTVEVSTVQAQSLKVDIYDQYLSGVGPASWPSYASPAGAYVQVIARDAEALGAVPMYTLYQMAARGDGDLSGLQDYVFMQQYWSNVRLLFTQLGTYGKPALVNLEPDFWGYAQRSSRDPTQLFAHVSLTSIDCPHLGDEIQGVAGCLMLMARKYAPNAFVGFPPSFFADLLATEPDYMKSIGADKADFVVKQTLDRDIGCIEAAYVPAGCVRATDAKLWDTNNLTSPNFKEHFASARGYFEALGLPLIWWQTPLGVPSATPGGTPGAFRDNRASYFLTHGNEMVAAGGMGVVFSTGPEQTTISTDGGQFKRLSDSYLTAPTPLP